MSKLLVICLVVSCGFLGIIPEVYGMPGKPETYTVHRNASNHEIVFAWEDPATFSADSQQQMQKMFIDTFFLQYRTHGSFAELSDAQLKEDLKNYFIKSIRPRFSNKDKQYFLTARHNGKIIGFVFWEDIGDNQAYVAELAIAADYCRQGLGKIFMGSAFAKMPNTKKIVLLTQHLNKGAKYFYEAIGYKPSTYMHEGYSPAEFCAYELVVN